MKNKRLIEDIYPLSPLQAGLLFQNLYSPELDIYFVQSIFELKGDVNSSYLKQAWEKITNHHSISLSDDLCKFH